MTNGRPSSAAKMGAALRRNDFAISNKLNEVGRQCFAELRELLPNTEIAPEGTDYQVFRDNSARGDGCFTVKPFTLRFPAPGRPLERGRKAAPIYVHIQGWLRVTPADGAAGQFDVSDFGTEVAYFEETSAADGVRALDHIVGMHFDLDITDPTHPRFHVQLTNYAERADDVIRDFSLQCQAPDNALKAPKQLRVPSAQMDVFSTLLHVAADRFAAEGKTAERARYLKGLRDASSSLRTAIAQAPLIDRDRRCWRGANWFDNPVR